MDSHDPFWGFLRHFPLGIVWLFIWIIARDAFENRLDSRATQHRVDVEAIARNSSRRRASSRLRRDPSPVLTPSPRSHPLWDRELDG
jgi:hypothetical protein